MANGAGVREEVEEITVSKIKTGMKREFKMMMKAQGDCGKDFGARKVTKSQNEVPRTNTAAKNVFTDTSSGGNGLKSFNTEKEVKPELAEEINDDEASIFDCLVDDVDGYYAEQTGMPSEEEVMSDILDGISDDDVIVKRIDDEMTEEEGKGVRGEELVYSDVVMNVDAMGANVGALVVTEGPTDGILERVNEHLPEIGKERGMMSTSVEVGNAIETSDAGRDAMSVEVGNAIETSDAGRDAIVELERDDNDMVVKESEALCTLTPLKHYTRRSKGETFEQSGVEDVRVVMENEDSAPIRRFTRSLMNKSLNAPGQSGLEDEKGDVLQCDAGSSLSSFVNMELKMSKKVELKKIPVRLNELLHTGFLEGLQVSYVKGAKARVPGEAALRGEICGSGISCFCKDCKGSKVVTPTVFELHAGSRNKRPPEYIYLDNGKPLRDILNLCKTVPFDLLERAIQVAVGRVEEESSFRCLCCKGSINQCDTRGTMLCDTCTAPRESQVVSPVSSYTSAQHCLQHSSGDSQPVAAETNSTSERSLPSLYTKSVQFSSNGHSRSKGQGRVTRKDLRLHKLVFESDLLPDGTELAYYANGQKISDGYKSEHGIFCKCCNQVVSPSLFENHAGFAKRRKPYLHIYTSNGVSLHELSIEIKKGSNTSTDVNDEVCSVCEVTGELLCCDNCPRAFHKDCINLPNIPQDRWYCKYCEDMFQRENFVASNINAVAAGRIAGADPFEEIKKRCIRIVESSEILETECVLCRGSDFIKAGFGPRTVILCDQCEGEHHIGCLKEHGVDDLKALPDTWFCSKECRAMFSSLQDLVDYGDQKLPDSMLSIIKNKQETVIAENIIDLSLTWRVLRGKVAAEEHRKWLSGAVSVFHDQLDIGYSKSSRDDFVRTMIYGRRKEEKDFRGMYCALLIQDSKVVSAGIFRVFGQKLAEIPLVATSSDYQGKGYFQALLGSVEQLLASFKVEEIVLPSASETEAMWKNKFGFADLSDEQLNNYRKLYPVMLFSGSTMLRKPVPMPETSTAAANALMNF